MRRCGGRWWSGDVLLVRSCGLLYYPSGGTSPTPNFWHVPGVSLVLWHVPGLVPGRWGTAPGRRRHLKAAGHGSAQRLKSLFGDFREVPRCLRANAGVAPEVANTPWRHVFETSLTAMPERVPSVSSSGCLQGNAHVTQNARASLRRGVRGGKWTRAYGERRRQYGSTGRSWPSRGRWPGGAG